MPVARRPKRTAGVWTVDQIGPRQQGLRWAPVERETQTALREPPGALSSERELLEGLAPSTKTRPVRRYVKPVSTR